MLETIGEVMCPSEALWRQTLTPVPSVVLLMWRVVLYVSGGPPVWVTAPCLPRRGPAPIALLMDRPSHLCLQQRWLLECSGMFIAVGEGRGSRALVRPSFR